jgi:hypothetical protein
VEPDTSATAVLTLATVLNLTAATACESPDQTAGDRDDDQPAPSTETPGVEWAQPIEVARGDAQKGEWRMNDSRFHYVDDPTVDLVEGGPVGVAWVNNERQNVYFQTYEEGEPQLDSPVDVSRSPDTFSWLPRIAMTGPPGDHVYILWQEIVFSGGSHGGEAFFARSTDGGETFEQPTNLSNTKRGVGKGRLTSDIWHNGSLDLAVGDAGEVYVAWTSYQGPLQFRRSTDGGDSFEAPIHVAGSGKTPARAPTMAVGPDETIYLAWTVGEDGAADLRIAVSEDGGESFGEPTTILESDGHADGPKLGVGPEGTLHLVYGESAGGMFEQYDIRYARSPNPSQKGVTFDDSTRISQPHGEGLESSNFPSMALDGDGDIFVVWNRYPDHERPSVGLGFSASFDGGDSFVSPSIVPGSTDPELGFNGSLQGMLMRKLAVDDSGRTAVVHSRFHPGEASRVRLHLGEADPP